MGSRNDTVFDISSGIKQALIKVVLIKRQMRQVCIHTAKHKRRHANRVSIGSAYFIFGLIVIIRKVSNKAIVGMKKK